MSYEIAVRALMERLQAAGSRATDHALVGANANAYLAGYLVASISQHGVADLNDLSAAVEAYERDVEQRIEGRS